MNMEIEEKSNEYSFNIQSKLFHLLPEDLRDLWVEETKKHFINRYKEGNVWHKPEDKLPDGVEQVLIYTDTQHYYVADFDEEAKVFYDIINRPYYVEDILGWRYLPKFNL